MKQKQIFKWGKVVLFGLLIALNLSMLPTAFLMIFRDRSDVIVNQYASYDRYYGSIAMYYLDWNAVCLAASVLGFSIYGLLRCFRSAQPPRGSAEKRRRVYRVLLFVFLALFCLFLALDILTIHAIRTEPDEGERPALDFYYVWNGRLTFGMNLIADGILLSLIRRRELKRFAQS